MDDILTVELTSGQYDLIESLLAQIVRYQTQKQRRLGTIHEIPKIQNKKTVEFLIVS